MVKNSICVWWASVTRWAWDPEMWGWACRLRHYLDNSGWWARVYNLWISAETTENLLRRFEVEAQARNPDIIMFSIGNNDSSYVVEWKDTITLSQFEINLKQLIFLAKKFTDTIIFVGLNRVDETKVLPAPRWRHAYYPMDRIITYSSKTKEVCEQEGAFFLDMLNVVDLTELADGLHPNAQWHEKIYLRVRDFLLERKLI